MGIEISGPASAAIVTGAQLAGTAFGGPIGGAVAGFVASGIMSSFSGGNSITVNGTSYTESGYQQYVDQQRLAWMKSHGPILSSERERLTQGRTTRTSSFKQALPPRRRVYGTVDQGAPLLLHQVISPYTYVGYALSDGPISSVTHVSIGGTSRGITGNQLTDDSVYSSFLLYVGIHAGEGNQLVDDMLASAVGVSPITKPETYRHLGVATAFARLHYGNDPDAGGEGTGLVAHHNILWGGRTVFEYTIAGLIVDDFSAGTAYTANPSKHLYDLVQCDWPGSIAASELDKDSFISAATDCDNAGFECHGVVYADDQASKSIQSILTTCDASLIRPNGQYKMKVDKPSASVLTITDDDMILGLEYSPDQSLDDAPNIIRATYGGGLGEVIVSDDARLAEEQERQLQITLDNVKNAQSAEILARRELARLNRPALPIVINDIAQMLEVLDVVTVTSATLPEASGEYKILSIDEEVIGSSLLLREYSENDYA